jgi:hypothetical protein
MTARELRRYTPPDADRVRPLPTCRRTYRSGSDQVRARSIPPSSARLVPRPSAPVGPASNDARPHEQQSRNERRSRCRRHGDERPGWPTDERARGDE